jgi:hypothetical protein
VRGVGEMEEIGLGTGVRGEIGFIFFVNSRYRVIPPIWRYRSIPNLRGICHSRERVDSGSSFYRTRELGPGAGPTHPIPPHDSNRTHPKVITFSHIHDKHI